MLLNNLSNFEDFKPFKKFNDIKNSCVRRLSFYSFLYMRVLTGHYRLG
ncbi:hypothetical protein MmTuc01_3044 [Methanosarcina mazei Tuc01]|uniref:Uncharacterized protein n=1 Tax=Methanosarcina mazei Tuc01 TaxID=1236903 RepID=M1QDH6_METMZ|nr:hypothetical protein MmTuc01_3044 [Methanosarcina mazei Tuc01]